MSDERLGEKQLRLQQEAKLRKIADELKAKLMPGEGFAMFLMDTGAGGEAYSSFSYVATVEREGMRRLLIEWLHKTGGLPDAIAGYITEQIENRRHDNG